MLFYDVYCCVDGECVLIGVFELLFYVLLVEWFGLIDVDFVL